MIFGTIVATVCGIAVDAKKYGHASFFALLAINAFMQAAS